MTVLICHAQMVDPEAVERGRQKVATASLEMIGLERVRQRYEDFRPLREMAILGCVTITPQTAAYMLSLVALGAGISWCSDNRFASDSDVIEFVRSKGIPTFARPNMTLDEYFSCMNQAIAHLPDRRRVHIHDDGCDITRHIVETQPDFLKKTDVSLSKLPVGQMRCVISIGNNFSPFRR
jgi:adenosylhomocysteinase